MKTYQELISFPTFEERFEYLKLGSTVGVDTFGAHRYLNQSFYQSYEWQQVRNEVILRDKACDLGIEGREIFKYILVHHINPITYEDLLNRTSCVFDLDNLICVSKKTHNAIHFSDKDALAFQPVERKPNDTCLWR